MHPDHQPGAPDERETRPLTLLDVLERRVEAQPDRLAYTFCHENGERVSLTFAELRARACAIGQYLRSQITEGERVVLVYPPGLEFVTAFLGCMYAGAVAVPTTYPKPRRPMRRLDGIARDCGATVALTDSATRAAMTDYATVVGGRLRWLATDTVAPREATRRPTSIASDDLAFLQYTSGSTGDPKGVMVTHANVLHNLEMIYRGFDANHIPLEERVGVFWLPAYHDMGLIGGVLGALYHGTSTVLLSPASFLQRPLRWLELMSEWKGTISAAPNFAYQLCVDRSTPQQRRALDLSHWRIAICGGEPIRPTTLRRFCEALRECGFEERAVYPSYGLAEATPLDHRVEERDCPSPSRSALGACRASRGAEQRLG